MNDGLRERVIAYRTTMSVVKEMYRKSVIFEEEYIKIDKIIAKIHGLDSSTIFSDIR